MQTILAQLRYPLIQAPMAGVQDAALAIAVCREGGLGSLPAAMFSPERLDAELHCIRAATRAPYNLNFFAHRSRTLDAAARDAWHQALQPWFARFHVDSRAIPADPGRRPFDRDTLTLVEKHRPPVVSFHFGLPEPELLAAVRASGAKIMASATTVAEARWLATRGVDAIIAQGLEAGGHRGHFLSNDLTLQSGTFALLPAIRRAVNLPVIAAGSIGDAATVNAAFALGADAVQVGTAFLLADEAKTSAAHRAALQDARAEHTTLTNLFSGGLARGIVNAFMQEAGCIHPAAPPFPLAGAAISALRKAAEETGNHDFSPFWAGQNAPLARAGNVAQIIVRLFPAEGLGQ